MHPRLHSGTRWNDTLQSLNPPPTFRHIRASFLPSHKLRCRIFSNSTAIQPRSTIKALMSPRWTAFHLAFPRNTKSSTNPQDCIGILIKRALSYPVRKQTGSVVHDSETGHCRIRFGNKRAVSYTIRKPGTLVHDSETGNCRTRFGSMWAESHITMTTSFLSCGSVGRPIASMRSRQEFVMGMKSTWSSSKLMMS